MKYFSVHTDIKTRMRRCGLVARDLAQVLGEHPKTTNARLNGSMGLTDDQRGKIVALLEKSEAKLLEFLESKMGKG